MTYRAVHNFLYTFGRNNKSKTNAVILHLVAFALLCSSCTKEGQKPVVTLQVNLENRAEEIEWMEVQGSRLTGDGVVFIEATGFQDERFKLNLRNVTDTGLVPGITINNVFCSEGAQFNPGIIQSGFLRITRFNANTVAGIFEMYFRDERINSTVKAGGSFKIEGSE